jgi:hypothetical protein
MGLNLYESGEIYANMLQFARYPESMFTGTPETLAALREAIERQTSR